jgi:hypothetical protein
MNMKKILSLSVIVLTVAGVKAQMAFSTNDYVRALKSLTDVMINDVTSPVAASRYYAYITLAANETLGLFDARQPRFSEIIKGLTEVKREQELIDQSDQSFAVILALYTTGARLLPSGYILKKQTDSLLKVARKKKIPEHKIQSTVQAVDKVVDEVMKYAITDGFVRMSGYKKFTPQTGDEYWQPTGPGFMAALEPYWNTLRTFILDSCTQFNGGPPAKYDTTSNSDYYKLLKEVYDISMNLTPEQADIANFWDCNPFALQQVGHLEYGIKKMSPGGHWMGITGIACKKQKLNLAKTTYTHALVSLGMSDAFVSCWHNKYKYNRVRPVTAIKRLIDRNWNPLLQTPPFPEYTSGHSVLSTTAAIILTNLFGNNFSYVDDTEKEFGLPARKFSSFKQASSEAAISRLYGGIHYRDAIDNGVREGEQIGNYVVMKSARFQSTMSNNSLSGQMRK